jgi:hypothetical protein
MADVVEIVESEETLEVQVADGIAAVGGAAANVTFTPAGSISATNVQDAIEEVASESAAAAEDVSFTPAGDISATDVQAALEELDGEKAPLASPAFSGTPTAPTADPGTNTTQIASTAFVAAAVAALIASAPGALDTLDELAAALGDDANFAATITTTLAGKQPLHANLTAFAGLSLAAGDDKKPEAGFNRFMLAMRIHEADGACELTIDEAKLIKDRVAKVYPALVMGRVWQALEGAAEGGNGKKKAAA